ALVVEVQRDHLGRAAPLQLERPEAVPGPDLEHPLALERVGQVVAVDVVPQVEDPRRRVTWELEGVIPAVLARAFDQFHEWRRMLEGAPLPHRGEARRSPGGRPPRGPVLASPDAASLPAPGGLEAGLAAIDGGAQLVQGRVGPPPGVERGPWDRFISVEREYGLYETANLFVSRDVF